MTDEQKKLVAEWLGEKYHRPILPAVPRHRYDFNPPVICSCGREACEQTSRDFTAEADFFACFNRLVELGEWKEFYKHTVNKATYDIYVGFELYDYEMFIWLHSKLPDGTYRLCELCEEWVEKGEAR